MNNIHLVVENLPELETEVGISGSVKQQEVGSYACIGILIIAAAISTS